MAKIASWEAEIRSTMESLARHVNRALNLALMEQNHLQQVDPENVPAIDLEDPDWPGKLAPRPKRMVQVWAAIIRAIRAEEEQDAEELEHAMRVLSEFIDGMPVELEWSRGPEGYRLVKRFEGDMERYPMTAATWMLGFADYLTRYSGIVHLGVCRQCDNVYLKPKHGQKMRYCSHACAQKAYRERKKAKGS